MGSAPFCCQPARLLDAWHPSLLDGCLPATSHPSGATGWAFCSAACRGVPPATVVIVGGGVLGANAARAFLGLGAEVTLLDWEAQALQRVDEQFNGRATTMFANEFNLGRAVRFADVLIGAISTPGRRAPILITREMVRQMRPGSVIMDFAIDQGGCVETSHPTTLRDPAYLAEGIIHYAVPNGTAVYARTTSYAITSAALPYLLAVGKHGLPDALREEPELASGINLLRGQLAHSGIAAALGRETAVELPLFRQS